MIPPIHYSINNTMIKLEIALEGADYEILEFLMREFKCDTPSQAITLAIRLFMNQVLEGNFDDEEVKPC